jgi:MraZ protein
VFLGNYDHSVDNKGRMAVPARFRAELGERMFITRWLDKCLALYPADQFEELANKVGNLSIADPNARNLRRIFFSEAAEVELDKQGRINIPARLRQYAGLDTDEAQVVVVGMNTYIEIWSPELWNQLQDEVEENAGSIASQLANLGAI